jgi:hypothetical protein
MKENEIYSFQIGKNDDVRTFIGPINGAVVITEHYTGNSLFLQMAKDAGICLDVVRGFMGLAGNVIEYKFRTMDGGEDVTEAEAKALVDLAQLAVWMDGRKQMDFMKLLAEGAGKENLRLLVGEVWKWWHEADGCSPLAALVARVREIDRI